MKRLLVFLAVSMLTSFNSRVSAQTEWVGEDDGHGYYKFKTSDGVGIANEMYDVIIPPTKDYISYDKGFFVIYREDGYDVYDRMGRNIIPSSRGYSSIYPDTHDGFRFIRCKKGKSKLHNVVCDVNGNELISPERGYDAIYLEVQEGVPFFQVKKGNKYGVCNAAGKEITPPIHKYIRLSKSYIAKKKMFEVIITDSVYRYDREKISFGREVNFPLCSNSEGHHGNDGFSWYEVKPNGYGAKDILGNILVPEKYKIESFKKGYFIIKEGDYRGVYDKSGNCIIPTNRRYNFVSLSLNQDFIYFSCWRNIGGKKSQAGVCDANGKELISPDRGYKHVWLSFEQGIPFFYVVKDKKEGLCNAGGKEIVRPIYKHVFVYSGTVKGDKKRLLYISDALFDYDKKSISFGEDIIQSGNYLARTDITKELSTESVAGFKYYKFIKDGMYGALSTEGKLIVPPLYKFITFDDFSDALLAIAEDGSQAMYTKGGQILIPASRGYTFIMRWEDDGYGGYYQVERGKNNLGFCNAGGTEIISPNRGYTDISLSNYKSTWFIIVQKNGKYGACTISGREIVEPIYEDLAIRDDKGTFVGKTSNGNVIDLKVKPNGYKEQEINYYAEEEKKAQRRANRQRWLSALGAGLAGAANAYANVLAQQAARPNVPSYTPSMPANSYAGSSSYSTSPAYLAQVQARADRSMANYQAQLQRIGQQALANNQQMINRSKNMFSDMINWSFRFRSQNGREPTDLEKSQWVKQHYPDMYASYVQAQAAQYERASTNTSSDDEPTESKKEISNTYDCSYCGGTGRLLQEDETLSFGLSAEKDYKCQECGKWKYKGKTHRHYNCTHCKGSGKVTFK